MGLFRKVGNVQRRIEPVSTPLNDAWFERLSNRILRESGVPDEPDNRFGLHMKFVEVAGAKAQEYMRDVEADLPALQAFQRYFSNLGRLPTPAEIVSFVVGWNPSTLPAYEDTFEQFASMLVKVGQERATFRLE